MPYVDRGDISVTRVHPHHQWRGKLGEGGGVGRGGRLGGRRGRFKGAIGWDAIGWGVGV